MKDAMKAWLVRTLLGLFGVVSMEVVRILQKDGTKLIALAKAEIARLDGETMDETDKRKACYLAVKEAAKAAGIRVRDSVVDYVIANVLLGMRLGVDS